MTHGALKVDTVLICKNFMLREGLRHILSSTRFNVLDDDPGSFGPSEDGEPEAHPGLFIVDVNMHRDGTADLVRNIKIRSPEARVAVLADGFDPDSMMMALNAGANGYCLSSIGCEVLVKYLDLIMLGELVFPSALFLSTLAAQGRLAPAEKQPSAEGLQNLQVAPGSPVRTLSSREAEILQCLMQGAPNKIIARRLEVAEATVKVHIKAILRKIRVTNRTQAAMWAVAHLPTASVDDSRVAPR